MTDASRRSLGAAALVALSLTSVAAQTIITVVDDARLPRVEVASVQHIERPDPD